MSRKNLSMSAGKCSVKYVFMVALFTAVLLIVSSCVTKQRVAGKRLVRKESVKKQEKPIYVWWEAEDAKSHTFPESDSFKAHNPQEASKLSGETWLQTDKGSGVEAVWEVDVPKSGTYHFWTRKFWLHGPFKWHFNDQPERTCTRKCGLVESVQIRRFLCADWVDLGDVTLKKGKNTLYVKALDEASAIAFDCWVLTNDNFIPKGPNKPGEKYNKTEPGWFAFEPDYDEYTNDAMFDMREFNQEYAGVDGFVKAEGEDFVFEKTGEKVKFWAVNAIIPPTKSAIDELAKQLSKRGVNMVRIHSPFHNSNDLKLNKKYWDKVQYFIHKLAQEGIYTKLSFYFPLWVKVTDAWNIPGYAKNKNKTPFGLLFFQSQMQKIYKAWVKDILTSKNPYSGKAIKDDPAVAIIEIVNEDGMFFWTFSPYNGTPKEVMVELEEKFGDWLKKKYGSLKKAKETWGNEKQPKIKDEIDKGRVALYQNMGYMGNFDWALEQRNHKRIKDQVQFLVELQRNFYIEMGKYYKNELGYKGLLSASNWHTVDNRTLGALEKYTYTATDVIDRHGYLGGMHKGPRASYAVSVGDTYKDRPALKEPDSLTKEILYDNKPHIISEYNYPSPNRFRSEGPFMIATYGSLAGTDGFFYFRVHTAKWSNGNGKFPAHTPVVMGQFPAFSHIYRKGYIKEGPKVVNIDLSLKDLYDLKGTPVTQPQHLDELRKKDIPVGGVVKSDKADSIDPLAYYVGEVQFNFTKDKNSSEVKELSKYIDRDKKTIKSATDQLFWNWGTGYATFNVPEAQGACGFLKAAGKIKLDDVEISTDNEYLTVAVVALDDKPIKDSARILVQVMTEDKNCGEKASGTDVKKVVSRGEPPIIVKNINGEINIKHSAPKAMKIFALDANGYKKEQMKSAAANNISINLKKDVIYYIITK